MKSEDRDKLVSSKRGDLLAIKYCDMKSNEGITVWFHALLNLALYEKNGQRKVAAALFSL